MRTIILKLTLDGEDEYEYQDVSTLLVVENFVLCHLPDCVDIQILSDSDDKTEIDTYRDLTVMALQMRNEIFAGAGMDKEQFTATYLNNLGDYERKVAADEGIEI